jgi:UDP-N-acetylmuramoyl-tripeptide--D-alanyl-D-alanine ligase
MRNVATPQTLLTVRDLAIWGRAGKLPAPALGALPIAGVSNDSRTIGPGQVFVALTTEKDDGHRYVAKALQRGAVAALVARGKTDMVSAGDQKKLIVVADPLTALHRMALEYRLRLAIPIIGITGSSGKTTARGFIAAVLKQSLSVGETSGNLNNHIGVPLSLLKFTGKEEVGVIEMGANHAGEIHRLSRTVRPTIGIVTNIGYAHIGYFGSLDATTRAKLEIIDGMKRRGGFLMLNGDDARLVGAARKIEQQVVFFGFSRRCHIRACNAAVIGADRTVFNVEGEEYQLGMPGRHFIYSALSALYIGRHFGIEQGLIAGALASMKPIAMRGTVERKSGSTFIVDCYNANPSSMKSAIGFLSDISGKSRKVAVVGDMLELGAYSRRLHEVLGKQLAEAKVERILAVGAFGQNIADGAVRAGMRQSDIIIAPDSAAAVSEAKTMVRPGDVVLLKGSRGVRLETILEGF